jgi:hypothetical protein
MLTTSNVRELLQQVDKVYEESERDNQQLRYELQLLQSENQRLQELVQNSSVDSMLANLLHYLIRRVPLTMLHSFLTEMYEDDNANRLELAQTLLRQDQPAVVLSWCKELLSLQYSEPSEVKKWTALLISVMDEMMDQEYEDIEVRNETYFAVIEFIHERLYSEYHDVMLEYLEKFYENFHDLIIDNNEPFIIAKYLQCLLDYRRRELFSRTITQLVKEWPFLDTNVSEKEFILFLYYSFLDDMDVELVDHIDACKKNFQTFSHEIELYKTFYLTLDGEIPLRTGKEMIQNLAKQQTVLDENLMKWVLDKIYQMLFQLETTMKGKLAPESKPQMKVKQLYLIPVLILRNHGDIINHVKNEQVSLSLYKNKDDIMVRKEIIVDALFSPNTGKHYVTRELVPAVRKKAGSFWFDLRESDWELFQNNHPQLFPWPITSAEEGSHLGEQLELKNNSDLRKLGYQITGLTRQKRWEILSTVAVPQLGLKKVAYTIAFLIRGRKSMKNGLVRNRHSITEWEHDIAKLKNTYYKNSFHWPKT